ncbi:hypothetical protein, partial [Solihabitans fulvus]|uniref:hypothetical protein n=1 Tax=Solihabitans fulvus TaxID=1892852 RepID=UPI001CB766EE
DGEPATEPQLRDRPPPSVAEYDQLLPSHRKPAASAAAVEPRPAPQPAENDPAVTVDMAAAIGPGWSLTQTTLDRETGIWRVRHAGRLLGVIERRHELHGRGWSASRDGVTIAAFGTFTARKGSALWRTRDNAAAGIAFDAVQRELVPRSSMP